MNETVNGLLAKMIDNNQHKWDVYLDYVAFFYNASVHESTKFSPHFLVYGRECRWNFDFILDNPGEENKSPNDYASLLVNRLEYAHEFTLQSLSRNAERMRSWYDAKVHNKEFKVGDEVYCLDMKYAGKQNKWIRRYQEIGKIVAKINNVTYKIQCAAWRDKYRILHVDKLKLRQVAEAADASSPMD